MYNTGVRVRAYSRDNTHANSVESLAVASDGRPVVASQLFYSLGSRETDNVSKLMRYAGR